MEDKDIEELWTRSLRHFLKIRFRQLSKKVSSREDLKRYCLEISYERYLRENFGFSLRDSKAYSPIFCSLDPAHYQKALLEFSQNVSNIPDSVFYLSYSNLVDQDKFTKFVLKELKLSEEDLDSFLRLISKDWH